jgi:hypothetical protein
MLNGGYTIVAPYETPLRSFPSRQVRNKFDAWVALPEEVLNV